MNRRCSDMEETYQFQESSELGRVEIAPEVLEVISSLAASEVEGVSYLNGGFVGGIVEKFGRKTINKGVKVELGEDHIAIDVSIVVQYGIHIPDVASEVQQCVQRAIHDMTRINVLEVNVHVVGVDMKNRGNGNLNTAEEV